MGEKAQVVNKSSPKKTFKWLGSSHEMKIGFTESMGEMVVLNLKITLQTY